MKSLDFSRTAPTPGAHRDDISRRVDEILATRTKAIDKALMSAAERVGFDEPRALCNLKCNAVMAMRAGDRAAAARSIELIGKHLVSGCSSTATQIDIAYADDADESSPRYWPWSMAR